MIYKPGDRVMIKPFEWVNQWNTFNAPGMKHWCGKIMTIREQHPYHEREYFMVEDQDECNVNPLPGWAWNVRWFQPTPVEINVDELLQVI